MKQVVFQTLLLLSLSIFLVQCVATQKDMEYTNIKMRNMDTKVTDIDQEVEELKKQTVSQVQTRQAETDAAGKTTEGAKPIEGTKDLQDIVADNIAAGMTL